MLPIKCVMDCLCPKDKEIIIKWRREAAESEIHAYISREEVQRVDAGVARELRGIDVQPMSKNQLVELAKIIGLPHTGSKQTLLTRLQPIITSINGWLIVCLLAICCITTTKFSAKIFTPIYLLRYGRCNSWIHSATNTMDANQGRD